MSTTEIDLDALLSAGRDAIIRAFRGSTDEDWPSLVLQIPTLIAAIRERDARIAALTATPPPTADLVALVREIANRDGESLCSVGDFSGEAYCMFCHGGERQPRSPYAVQIGTPPWRVWHEPDCHWMQARAIVARLEGKEPE